MQERVDGIPVPVVGAAARINDTPHFIEPFAKFSGQRFPGLARSPERRLGDNGSNHTASAEHLGQGRGCPGEQAAGDTPRKLHVTQNPGPSIARSLATRTASLAGISARSA